MSESELIERLAAAVADRVKPTFSQEVELWDMEIVAQYLRRNIATVRKQYACLPSFPKAIRLPATGTAQALYNASEVIVWAQRHKEKN
jgi:hypothetical protein